VASGFSRSSTLLRAAPELVKGADLRESAAVNQALRQLVSLGQSARVVNESASQAAAADEPFAT
jgi:hypothetical protein